MQRLCRRWSNSAVICALTTNILVALGSSESSEISADSNASDSGDNSDERESAWNREYNKRNPCGSDTKDCPHENGTRTIFRDPTIGCQFQDCPEYNNPMYPWNAGDHVEVYYCEFLLSHWVLDHAPWNAYHSGLAMVNNRTGKRVLFDYAPLDTESVTKLLIPEIKFNSTSEALLLGRASVRWRNGAQTKFRTHWSDDWKKFIRVAVTNGSVINRFADWVFRDFKPNRDTFDSLEVVSDDVRQSMRSTMCHDFVTDGMKQLYESGVRFYPQSLVFRDHIILYANRVEHMDDIMGTAFKRRAYLRYWRMLELFKKMIMEQFTYGREALLVNWKLGLPMYLNSRHLDYKIWLSPPFLNYCYLPLAMPPQKHQPWSVNKLCALTMEANLTNTSVPWDAMLIGVEDKIDRPDSLAALLLTAFITATMGVKGHYTLRG